MELGKAVEGYRLHNQGVPNYVFYNPNYPPLKSLIKGLEDLGHKVNASTAMSVVQAIYKDGDDIYAVSDPRKHGKPAGS